MLLTRVGGTCWGPEKTTSLKFRLTLKFSWVIFRGGSLLTFQVIECGFEGLLIIEDLPSMESLARPQRAIDLEVGRISHEGLTILGGTFLSVLGHLITPDLEQD